MDSQLNLISSALQAVALFGLLLLMFRLRRTFGLGPLFLTLGSLEGLKYFIGQGYRIDVPGLGDVALSSTVYYPATLAVLLLVYLRDDAIAARKLVWSLVLASLGVGLLTALLLLGNWSADSGLLGPSLGERLWRLVVGSTLLFLDALVLLGLYQLLLRWRVPFLLRAWLALSVVAAVDTVAFNTLVDWQGALYGNEMVATMLAKSLCLGLYSCMLSLYLRVQEPQATSTVLQRRLFGDLFAMMTYRERFKALEQQVIRDGQTGLFNRMYLDTWLPTCLRDLQQQGTGCVIQMIDIDHFKRINDSHGHLAGDEVLSLFAKLLQNEVRRSDLVFRFGGEEFCVVQPGADLAVGEDLAKRFLQRLSDVPLLLGGHSIQLSCTIGLAEMPTDGVSALRLISTADRRLYQGKRAGRGRVVARDEAGREVSGNR